MSVSAGEDVCSCWVCSSGVVPTNSGFGSMTVDRVDRDVSLASVPDLPLLCTV